MMSDVVISGYLKDMIDSKFRNLSYKSQNAFDVENEYESLIPILYWTRDAHNLLNKLPNNKYIVIRGRIEKDPTIGLYVLVEQFDS